MNIDEEKNIREVRIKRDFFKKEYLTLYNRRCLMCTQRMSRPQGYVSDDEYEKLSSAEDKAYLDFKILDEELNRLETKSENWEFYKMAHKVEKIEEILARNNLK